MKLALILISLLGLQFSMAQSLPPPPIEDDNPFPIFIEDNEDPEAPATAEPAKVVSDSPVATNVTEAVASPAANQVATATPKPNADANDEEVKGESALDFLTQPATTPQRANCGHTLQPPTGFSTEVFILQLFLDRHNFSAGVIDGFWGKTTQESMRAWQQAQGLVQSDWVDVPLYVNLALLETPLTRVAITEADLELVTGPLPPTWSERAEMQLLGYETLGAMLAERHHTSERTLRYLNPNIKAWPTDLRVGCSVTVPNIAPIALEPLARLVVALDDCVIMGFDNAGKLVVRFQCSVAKRKAHLPPAGKVTIVNMAEAPNYTYDPDNYATSSESAKLVVPAGPRNPVGSRWIGLSLPGYGIHGTPRPNSVGRPESRGCFRLTNWNVEKLFSLLKIGMNVEIIQSIKDLKPQEGI